MEKKAWVLLGTELDPLRMCHSQTTLMNILILYQPGNIVHFCTVSRAMRTIASHARDVVKGEMLFSNAPVITVSTTAQNMKTVPVMSRPGTSPGKRCFANISRFTTCEYHVITSDEN